MKNKGKTISFQTVRCLGCGAMRFSAHSCDECGRKCRPGEVDPHLVDRRVLISRINSSAPSPLLSTPVENDYEILTHAHISEMLQSFALILKGLLKDPKSMRASNRMVSWLQSLEILTNRHSSLPAQRPNIAFHRSISEALSLLAQLWPQYSKALGASTPAQVSHHSEQGQEIINRAEKSLEAFENLVNATAAYEDTSISDQSERLLTAVTKSHPNLSLTEIGQYGKYLAEKETGVAVDESHGSQFVILDTIASVHMDPTRFAEVLASSARYCISSTRLDEIACEDGALDGIANSFRLLYESVAAFESTLTNEYDWKSLARRTIKFYGEIYEDVASPVFAWYNLLAEIKNQPYKKLVKTDATVLAKNLIQNATTSLYLQDSGANLRNAAQHGNSFSFEDDYIKFELRSFDQKVLVTEVINDIFSFFESLMAMSWSLSNALSQSGHEVPLSDEDASYMHISTFHMLKFYLKHQGNQIESADELGSVWSFVLRSEQEHVFELSLAVALGAPERTEKITIQTNAKKPFLVVPLSSYKKIALQAEQNVPPLDRMMAVLELRNASHIENEPLIDQHGLNYAAGCLGVALLEHDDKSSILHIRRLRELAGRLHNDEILSITDEVFRLYRKPDYLRSLRLKELLISWVEIYDPPSMPHASNVVVLT